MDLADLEHNTRDGLHVASLTGAWTALVTGFGGMHPHDSTIGFAPRLPEGITRLAFTVTVQRRRLRVEITDSTASYQLTDGEPLRILHYGDPVTASAAKPLVRQVPPATNRPPPAHPPGPGPGPPAHQGAPPLLATRPAGSRPPAPTAGAAEPA